MAVLALVAGLLLAVHPLLPTIERTAHTTWNSDAGPVDVALNPYRPAEITLEISGPLPEGDVVDTVRSAEPLLQDQRLRITDRENAIVVAVGSHQVVAPRPGDGPVRVHATGDRVTVDVTGDVTGGGAPPVRASGDWRPAVDSLALTPAAQAAGTEVSVELVADTRFDTRPSTAKIAVAVAAIVTLLAAVLLVWRFAPGERPTRPRPRFRAEDAVVLLGTGFGVLAGGATDDDGFIRLIAGNAAATGHIGNYVRWNNVPEAPFGWQYALFAIIGDVSWEPVLLRVLPWLVALVGWFVLRHLLYPQLVTGDGGRAGLVARTALTATFLLGWLVYGNSLRPELWFAVGTALVFWLVLEAQARGSMLFLVLACVVASWTIGTGPTGLWALTPLIVAAPAIWSWLCDEPIVARVAVALVCLACLGSVVVAMFADQSLGTVIAATDARTAYGPIYPVWADPLRYYRLFMSFATRQVVTYWAVLALGVLLVLVIGRRTPKIRGVALAPSRWLVWVSLWLVPIMALSPTKLPHHFGALILFGPLAAAVVTRALGEARTPRRARPWLTGAFVGLMAACTGLAFHRANTWWKLGTVGHVADTKPLAVAGIPLWPVLVAGGVGLGVLAWWTHRRHPRAAARRWSAVLVLAQVLFVAGTFTNTAVAMLRRDAFDPTGRYTMGAAALDAIRADGCRLERSIGVELDPAAGALPVPEMAPGPTGLPTWTADPRRPDTFDSGWLELPDDAVAGAYPVVVAVAGADAGHRVRAEFDTGDAKDLEPTLKFLGATDFSDIRVRVPHGATRLRVVAESDGPATWRRNILAGAPSPGPNDELVPFAVAAPRVPVTTPLADIAADRTVATAWNLAFFTPCLRQPVESGGRVEIPELVLSDSERPGSIAFSAKNGGPFASVIGLRTPVRVPVHAAFDDSEKVINDLDLVRLDPPGGAAPPTPTWSTTEQPRSGLLVGPDVALPGAGE